jgi:tetratricopeptide (TPR) repeat protein
MIDALEAAQEAGGDIRGQQSAAMLIVSGEQQQKTWHGRLFNLRVDDHPHPVEELKRLVSLRKAWLLFDQSNELALAQHFDEAVSLLRKAMELGPDITELKFRGSEILFRAGQVQEALALLREVFAREPIWAELIPRMAAVGLLPSDPALLKYMLDQRS